MPNTKLVTLFILLSASAMTACTLSDRPNCNFDGYEVLGITIDIDLPEALTRISELNQADDRELEYYEELSNGYCPTKFNCIDAVQGEKIIGKVCTKQTGQIDYPESCGNDTHLYKLICEPNSIDHCGEHNHKCEVENGISACDNGECRIKSCNDGYIIKDNQCVVDDTCVPEKCDIENAETIICNDQNACEATACVHGYHVYNQQCEPDSIENCGAHDVNCNIENAESTICNDLQQCEATDCIDNYHTFNNECESDSLEHCGAHNAECAIENAETVSCQNSSCIVDKCKSGFHKAGNSCDSDATQNCGESAVNCELTPGWAVGSCTNGACIVNKCQNGFYYENGQCHEIKNSNGTKEDPWGLIWDVAPRPAAAHNYATEICEQNGGRLPTPTEIYRNRKLNNGVNNVIGSNLMSDEIIWSDMLSLNNESMLCLNMNNGEYKNHNYKDSLPYRCVWDSMPRPITLSGINCHTNPGEQCASVKLGDITYAVDARDRVKMQWTSAAEECRKAGGRLPKSTELEAIYSKLPNSPSILWGDHTTQDSAFTYSNQSRSRMGLGDYIAFRCISDPVKLINGQPNFPQPKAKDAFIADPLLRIDKQPRNETTFLNAYTICMDDGGHLATEDELLVAYHRGLTSPTDIFYLTASLDEEEWNYTTRLRQNPNPKYASPHNSDNDYHATRGSSMKFFCAYRPQMNFDFSSMTNKIEKNGVSYYYKDRPACTLSTCKDIFDIEKEARSQNMRLASDGEIIYVLTNTPPTTTTTYSTAMYSWDNKIRLVKYTFGQPSLISIGSQNINDAKPHPTKLIATSVIQ